MNIQETLARNTRYYRKRQHISQEELAMRCGLARAQVGLIENGKNITISTLQRVATGLNISPMRLLVAFDDSGKPILDCPADKLTVFSDVGALYDDEEKNIINGYRSARDDYDNDGDSGDSDNGSNGDDYITPAKDSATDLKNCALVYWGNGTLEFQELSVENADPSIKIMSILLQTTSSDLEFFERYKAVWPEVMRLLKIKPDCEWK